MLIISHTEHFRNPQGNLVGWSSTVKEVDQLATLFDEVIHVACFYQNTPPAGMASYQQKNVRYSELPAYGGKGLLKLSVLWTAPVIIYRVVRLLKHSTHFQFRAPTTMGVYIIPLLSLYKKKVGWFKYAGNWIQRKPPASYRWQRFWLTNMQKRLVTVNGNWPSLPIHVKAFENPCLHKNEVLELSESAKKKKFIKPFNLTFIGRLDKHKGIDILLSAIVQARHSVQQLLIIGDGPEINQLQDYAKRYDLPAEFLGYRSRPEILTILAKSDFLVLPSRSEGFPKVVAEAWSQGCLPVVTNVSAISQYVQEGINGYLIEEEHRNTKGLATILTSLGEVSPHTLKTMAINGFQQAKRFTFENYLSHLQKELF